MSLIFRTQSERKVKESNQFEEIKRSSISINPINISPEKYIIVRGEQYKIKRKILYLNNKQQREEEEEEREGGGGEREGEDFNISIKQYIEEYLKSSLLLLSSIQDTSSSSSSTTTSNNKEKDIEMLCSELKEANKIIELQLFQLIENENKIQLLENKLKLYENQNEKQPQQYQEYQEHQEYQEYQEQCHLNININKNKNKNKNKRKNRLQEAIISTRDNQDLKVYEGNEDLFDILKDDNLSIEESVSSQLSLSPSTISSSISLQPSTQQLPCLFIAHDNPQLEKMISVANNNDLNLLSTIPIMLETKDKSGYTCIILGNILSISTTEDIQLKYQKLSTIQTSASSLNKSRGDQCIVCTNLVGFRFLLNNIDIRTQEKTVDIHLLQSQSESQSESQLLQSIKFEKTEQLNEFLSQCQSRVDVILSPFHENSWYPYWELPDENNNNNNNNNNYNNNNNNNISKSGLRKLAPQFRSNGVGYLRLGNDMSNFGTDFLSSDGMNTFISNYQLSNDKESIDLVDNLTIKSENLSSLITHLSESSKWIDRCDNLKKINLFLKTTKEFTDSEVILQQLITILTREASHSNLQVLKESLGCIEEFLNFSNRFSLNINNLLDQMKDLLKVIFKLIKHSNHGIIETSTLLLKVWFEIDLDIDKNLSILQLSHGSIFFQMITSIFHEIFFKVIGDLQLKWFNELIFMTGQRWCYFFVKNISTNIFNNLIREEIIHHIQDGLPILLCHRDEKIREASCTLFGNLLALDILWSKLNSSPSLSISELISFLSVEIVTDISLINHLSTSCTIQTFLNKITTELYWQKIIGKVFIAINVYFHRLKTFFDSIC